MEAGIGYAAEPALEAVGHRDSAVQPVFGGIPVRVDTGICIVEGELPVTVQREPIRSFELRLGEFGTRDAGGADRERAAEGEYRQWSHRRGKPFYRV